MTEGKKKQKPQTLGLDDHDYIRRATAAYYRAGGMDNPGQSEVRKHKGVFYVVLGIMADKPAAVYRIRRDDVLKRLKRWPVGVQS